MSAPVPFSQLICSILKVGCEKNWLNQYILSGEGRLVKAGMCTRSLWKEGQKSKTLTLGHGLAPASWDSPSQGFGSVLYRGEYSGEKGCPGPKKPSHKGLGFVHMLASDHVYSDQNHSFHSFFGFQFYMDSKL